MDVAKELCIRGLAHDEDRDVGVLAVAARLELDAAAEAEAQGPEEEALPDRDHAGVQRAILAPLPIECPAASVHAWIVGSTPCNADAVPPGRQGQEILPVLEDDDALRCRLLCDPAVFHLAHDAHVTQARGPCHDSAGKLAPEHAAGSVLNSAVGHAATFDEIHNPLLELSWCRVLVAGGRQHDQVKAGIESHLQRSVEVLVQIAHRAEVRGDEAPEAEALLELACQECLVAVVQRAVDTGEADHHALHSSPDQVVIRLHVGSPQLLQ
mmetsp:Transcript_70188/g.205301  ORF Transcript_70188/g.205301 Transcript_70188/m.205301 type:complete len:268 (+) Transcript_70188:317-1120(+)